MIAATICSGATAGNYSPFLTPVLRKWLLDPIPRRCWMVEFVCSSYSIDVKHALLPGFRRALETTESTFKILLAHLDACPFSLKTFTYLPRHTTATERIDYCITRISE